MTPARVGGALAGRSGRAAGSGWRWAELGLLALAAGVGIAAGLPGAALPEGGLRLTALAPALALVAAAFAIHVSLGWRRPGADQRILPCIVLLMGLGLALSQRVAPALATRQWAWLMIGLATLAVSTHLPYELRVIQRYRYTWAILGIVLVGVTLVAGRSAVPGGPRLWLGAGGLTFQPSEVLRLLLVFFMASYLEDKREILSAASLKLGPLRLMPLPYLAPLAAMMGVSLALLTAQRDLGAGLLLFVICLGMLYLVSGRSTYVLGGLALFVCAAWLLHHEIAVVQTRVAIWLDPWSDPSGAGYQIVQGLMAIAEGGVIGAGIGQGLPTSIPAVHTDFIYAALAEETGLAGAAAVLMVYATLFLAGFRVAVRASTPFRQMLAAGLTLGLSVQTLIILGGVLRLIPLTGVTLPFLSHGGTSIVTSAVAMGLVLRIGDEPR